MKTLDQKIRICEKAINFYSKHAHMWPIVNINISLQNNLLTRLKHDKSKILK